MSSKRGNSNTRYKQFSQNSRKRLKAWIMCGKYPGFHYLLLLLNEKKIENIYS
jgi:hypothetical protein